MKLSRPLLRLINKDTHSRLRVIIFYHIGKTGGSAINELFTDTLRKTGGTIHQISLPMNMDQTFSLNRLENLKSKLDKIQNGLCYLHCHHGSPGILEAYDLIKIFKAEIIQRGGKIAVTTVVREPFKRMLSNIRFDNVSISNAKGFAEKRSNHMSNYLLYNHPRFWPSELTKPKLDELRKILSLIDVVGCQDDLNKFTKETFRQIEFSPENTNVSRINVTKAKSGDDQVTKEIENTKFKELNELDYWLYDNYRKSI